MRATIFAAQQATANLSAGFSASAGPIVGVLDTETTSTTFPILSI